MGHRKSRQHRDRALPRDGRLASRDGRGTASGSEAPAPPTPDWDETRGELRFRDEVLVERGRKLAPVVEALLTALARAGWKPSTYDPVPPPHRDSQHPVAQLRQAVKRVKASLRFDWLDFHVHKLTVSWEDRVATGRAQSPPKKCR
ncbi:MAG TPA: hypothetical protein VND64_25475 [Pirellulales bacterium]|nr:hypothetical protein [Pirellulales bacterium]